MEKDVQKKIIELFNQQPEKLSKLDVGLTNDNFYFEINNQSYILRYPLNHHKNAKLEDEVLKKIRPLDIDTPLIYYDDKSALKVSKYIKNVVTFGQYHNDDAIIKTAEIMLKLHQANLHVEEKFDFLNSINKYRNHIKNLLYPQIENYHYIIEQISQINNPTCLCHNDFVEGNILFSKEKTYLIDYEYACENDPLFDVASFLSENKIYGHQREIFLNTYFKDGFSEEKKHQLDIFEKYENLLWCYWANMMYEIKGKNIYKQIAQDKYEALCYH